METRNGARMTRAVLLSGCIAMLMLLVMPFGAEAETEAEVRAAVEARYNAYNRAYEAKDFAAVATIFAADAKVSFRGGKKTITRDTLVAGMRAVAPRLTVTQAHNRLLALRQVGDGWEVDTEWQGMSSYAPPAGAKDDPPRRGPTEQRSTDTWKRVDGAWRIVTRVIDGADPD